MTAQTPSSPVAIVTGASRGFGFATARSLAERGWRLVVDARDPGPLTTAAGQLGELTDVEAIAGDVTEAEHRRELVHCADAWGGTHLLVNNASFLGPSPQPPLADYPTEVLSRVYDVNVIAAVALIRLCLPALRRHRGWVVNVTSDAATEGYPGWGGYGSSKAALDQVSRILGAEEPIVRVFAFDPGDMNTRMHQEAFPGEDISDRPRPEASVPALLALIDQRRPSGRYPMADVNVPA